MTASDESSPPAGARLGRLRHQLAVTLAGHGGDIALSTVSSLLIFANFTPSQWAFFAAALASLRIAHKVSDLGLDMGTVRAVSKARRLDDPEAEADIVQAVLLIKLVLSVAVFAIGWLSADTVASAVLNHRGLTPYLRLAYLGIFARQLLGFHKSWLAARLKFTQHALLVIGGPTLLLAGLLVAHASGQMTLAVCLAVTVLAPLVPVVILTALNARELLGTGFRGFGAIPGVWTFSRWTYLTEVLSAVRSELGTLVLLALLSSTAAGLYDAGVKLASRISILANSLLTVLMPRAARLGTRDELSAFLKQSHLWIALLVLGVPAAPLLARAARPLVLWVNPAFEPALGLFVILLISMLFTIAALPCRTVLYSVHRPEVETTMESVSLVVTITFYALLIPDHGALGAACATLVQRALAAGATMAFVYHKIRVRDHEWLRIDDPAETGQTSGRAE